MPQHDAIYADGLTTGGPATDLPEQPSETRRDATMARGLTRAWAALERGDAASASTEARRLLRLGSSDPRITSIALCILAEVAQATAVAAQMEIRAATDDAEPLTAREREVSVLIARGLSNLQIAKQLVIAPSTANRHVANILSNSEFRRARRSLCGSSSDNAARRLGAPTPSGRLSVSFEIARGVSPSCAGPIPCAYCPGVCADPQWICNRFCDHGQRWTLLPARQAKRAVMTSLGLVEGASVLARPPSLVQALDHLWTVRPRRMLRSDKSGAKQTKRRVIQTTPEPEAPWPAQRRLSASLWLTSILRRPAHPSKEQPARTEPTE
jgi:DNA-binding CsgD family transcriptional regulator